MASHLKRIVYLNGEFIPGGEATVSIFDRGLLFADAVYEGLGVRNGRIIDFEMHMARLRRSLGELDIPEPNSEEGFRTILETLIEANRMRVGFLYLHVTRGEADRNYLYDGRLKPNVFAFVQPGEEKAEKLSREGVAMRSHPDLRWKRRDIKTSNLLGQVMAKNSADRADAYEALMVDDEGQVTEGGATSFFMIKDDVVYVRPATNEILNGVTRRAMLKIAEQEKLRLIGDRYTLQQVFDADEAFITGASNHIQPVVEVDGRKIGNGKPGPVTLRLQKLYLKLCDAGVI